MSQFFKSWFRRERLISPKGEKMFLQLCLASLFICAQFGCNLLSPSIDTINPTETLAESQRASPHSNSLGEQPETTGNLTPDQILTLSSLVKVDDYPLYTMHFQGQYFLQGNYSESAGGNIHTFLVPKNQDWACSLFAALGGEENYTFGRNFDWEKSPALLLFTSPPDRYASVSMVDIAYLDFDSLDLGKLHEMELDQLSPLLDAPFWPFDGMNERGLAIGMAAVPAVQNEADLQKPSIGSLEIMRMILDKAADINEALRIIESYNIDFRGGPDLHYLIADKSGESILVEFLEGKMQVIPNQKAWHMATNFLVTTNDSPQGKCARYDRISSTLQDYGGVLVPELANELLSTVSQNNTQWSVLYYLESGAIQVTMGRKFDQTHNFQLEP